MLTEETAARVMRALNITFNMWQSHPDEGLIGYWRRELESAGMAEDNAAKLREGFCRACPGGEQTLGTFMRWIKEQMTTPHAGGYLPEAERNSRLAVLKSREVGECLSRMRASLEGRQTVTTPAKPAEDVADDEIPFGGG